MGYRLRVCKTYKVEYADKASFNSKKEELDMLLSLLNCSCIGIGDYYENDSFECGNTEYKNALIQLKALAKKIESEETLSDEEEEIRDAVNALYGRERFLQENSSDIDAIKEVINNLEEFYNLADKSDGYLHFCFI